MGDRVGATGWAVFRAHVGDVVSPRRRRARTVASGSAAAAAGVLLTISEVVWHWVTTPVPLAVLAIVSIAAAVGCLVAVVMPLADKTIDHSFHPTGDWRATERVSKQFGPRPPELDPADREAVLAAVDRGRDGLVLTTARVVFLPATWFCAALGMVAAGQLTSPVTLAFPVLFGLLQSASLVASTTSLGRMELARRRAEALPPNPPPPPDAGRPWPRGVGRPGSKLGLPGD